MRRFLSRRSVYGASLLLFALLLTYALASLTELRGKLIREYFEHKNFLFTLRNLPLKSRRPATEKEVSALLSRHGLEPQKIFKAESGVEVQLREVPWNLIPDLVKDLEDNFEIVKFSAVDNTGRGLFEVRIVVR